VGDVSLKRRLRLTQLAVIIDKAVAKKTVGCLFPKRSIQVQFLVGTPAPFVFELRAVFHFISSALIQFHTICGGKLGEAGKITKFLYPDELDLIIGLFSLKLNLTIPKLNIFSTGRGACGEAIYRYDQMAK
jgi:hypothetical protein